MSGPAAPPGRAASPGRTAPPGRTALLPSATAGLAVALSATSLTGILAGPRWWGFVVLTVAVVVMVAAPLRLLRFPAIAVAAAQLVALAGLVTAMFTRSGVLVALPGPEALREVSRALGGAARQVQVGVAPVPESTELLCLVVVTLGLVAVLVELVAVSAAAPAASGLVLLCVLAVPASLSDRLLPWWSFLLGAVGFALLLAVDGRRRSPAGDQPPDPGRRLRVAPSAIGAIACATLVALLAGSVLTTVGTEGRLATAGTFGSTANAGIGLNPFTALRGQLDAEASIELFRVRGLPRRTYLRALTLSHFVAGQGWQLGPLDGSVPAGGEPGAGGSLPLPAGAAEPVAGVPLQVRIEPINYVDHWLPSFGYPLGLGTLDADWRYDPDASTVFSERRQRARPYTETGVLPQPDPAQLRAAGPGGGPSFTTIDQQYLDVGGVDPRVTALAAQVAAGSGTGFDATVAVNQWFTEPGNGFRYDLATAPGNSGDALVDFLFTGRTGYCEQFASAMAIMLRTLGVPARVAVGFTSGTTVGDARLITTEDAHAWVEAWFPGGGWLPFDPTPLADGRTVAPSYLTEVTGRPDGSVPPSARQPAGPAAPGPVAGASRQSGTDGAGLGIGTTIGLGAAGLLACTGLVGLAPLTVREAHRRRRLRLAGTGGPEAASAAWAEVLAESADRGVSHPPDETVRGTAQRLTRAHGLDEPGVAGLRTLVGAVERSWYSAERHPGEEVSHALQAVRGSLARCAPTPTTARLLPRSVLAGMLPSRRP